jgi:hypothetical protein
VAKETLAEQAKSLENAAKESAKAAEAAKPSEKVIYLRLHLKVQPTPKQEP